MLTGDYSSCCRRHIAPCSCAECREAKQAKYSKQVRQQLQGLFTRQENIRNEKVSELFAQTGFQTVK